MYIGNKKKIIQVFKEEKERMHILLFTLFIAAAKKDSVCNTRKRTQFIKKYAVPVESHRNSTMSLLLKGYLNILVHTLICSHAKI